MDDDELIKALSVEELKALREKVQAELSKRLSEQAHFDPEVLRKQVKEDLKFESCTYVPMSPEDLADQDGVDSFPNFLVKGTYKGEPFEWKVGIEFDGRDAEWEHVSGYELDPNGGNRHHGIDDTYLEIQEQAYNYIGDSPAYNEVHEAYEDHYAKIAGA